MNLPFFLSLFFFAATCLGEQEDKLWPPRGNNRPLVAATQALWWNQDDPEARKLKARARPYS